MSTTHKDAMAALATAAATISAKFDRNASLPMSVPSGGLVIMRDGDPGEPTTYLGRPQPIDRYERNVDFEIYVQSPDDEATVYDLANDVATAVSGDLGGAVEWVYASAPEVDAVPSDGDTVLAARLPVIVSYSVRRVA